MHKNIPIGSCKTPVRQVQPSAPLLAGRLHRIAQVVGSFRTPMRDAEPVLAELVSDNEQKVHWNLFTETTLATHIQAKQRNKRRGHTPA